MAEKITEKSLVKTLEMTQKKNTGWAVEITSVTIREKVHNCQDTLFYSEKKKHAVANVDWIFISHHLNLKSKGWQQHRPPTLPYAMSVTA